MFLNQLSKIFASDHARRWLKSLIPSPGNILFTLLAIIILVWGQNSGVFARGIAAETSEFTRPFPYQGRLADAAGNPLTNTYPMIFRLYEGSTGGVPVWEEQWTGPNSVQVSDGLFNVMLGSLTPIAQALINESTNLWLGITVGTDDEMTPRVQLGAVPFSQKAQSVADNSITAPKIVDGSITTFKIADSSITTPKIEDSSVTTAKMANSSITTVKIADSSITTAKVIDGSITIAKLAPTALGQWNLLNNRLEVIYYASGGSFNWQVVDLSAFVPSTAKIVYLETWLQDSMGRGWCSIRPFGSTSGAGPTTARTVLADIYGSTSGIVALNSSKIEWRCQLQSGAVIRDAGINFWGYYEPAH